MNDAELEARLGRIERVLFGNGVEGVDTRVGSIEDALFKNRKTGKPGIVMRFPRVESMTTAILLLMVLMFNGIDLGPMWDALGKVLNKL